MGQSDHITALAIWHQGNSDTIVATSQLGKNPIISVWASSTMKKTVALYGFHKVGVSFLDFCPSGDLLLSIGMDKMNSIAVCNWRERRLVFTSYSTSRTVIDCRFLDSSSSFEVCGD